MAGGPGWEQDPFGRNQFTATVDCRIVSVGRTIPIESIAVHFDVVAPTEHRAMIERALRVHTGGCPAHHTVKDARKVYLGRRTPPRRHRGQELREAA